MAKKRRAETLPNGMRVPHHYGVCRGKWFSAQLSPGIVMLASFELEPPGVEWSPSRQTDDSGRPEYWMLEVPREALDLLVNVGVTTTWQGSKVGIVKYADGVVHARVEPHPSQEAKVERGEIPEIVMADRGDYRGTFRWEDLEDIRMEEKDLKK